MENIARNLEGIRQRITIAAQAAGRDPATIRLVAVSKMKSESDIHSARMAGQMVFGENRVQEAKTKFTGLRTTDSHIRLHLIGPLQTNKVEDAIRLFDVIETLDRPRLAGACADAIRKTGHEPEFYIEVNIGNEPQKAGIPPDALADFLAFCRTTCGLRVTGLMGLPPQHEDPMPYFNRLRELSELYKLPHLSMGMSGDFEAAIRCGATEVRIGTALFGPR